MSGTIALVVGLLLSPHLAGAAEAIPDDFTYRLEQVPGTHDVFVVGSMAVEGVQAWAWGVCFDPSEARIGNCIGSHQVGGDHHAAACAEIYYPDDLLISPCFDQPPDFLAVNVYENGIDQGVVLFCMGAVSYQATARLEMLRISFTVLDGRARLDFCDTIGDPAVITSYVHDGVMVIPAVKEGVTLFVRHDFVRGDVNADGRLTISDPIVFTRYLFGGPSHVGCLDACDANDDGSLDLADAVAVLQYLFAGGAPPPAPFPACGRDPTANQPELGCIDFAPCG